MRHGGDSNLAGAISFPRFSPCFAVELSPFTTTNNGTSLGVDSCMVECAATNPPGVVRRQRGRQQESKMPIRKRLPQMLLFFSSGFFRGWASWGQQVLLFFEGGRRSWRKGSDGERANTTLLLLHAAARSALINPSGVINRVEINLNTRLTSVVSRARAWPNRVTDHDDGQHHYRA